jgi:hypothetical protein
MTAEESLGAYLASRPEAVARLDRLVDQLVVEGVDDLAVITVAVRQIRGVAS